MRNIEIGTTYVLRLEIGHRYFIGLDNNRLLSFNKEREPICVDAAELEFGTLTRDLTLTFRDLADRWGVTAAQLDEASASYFQPDFLPESQQEMIARQQQFAEAG